ncbi:MULTISPECIES: hypothetical protein [unclassified Duganella]|jgi:hypothetical protein|uniref:hypothetical protein n=1 Tax=unclassified Duganella TaxID=2636909 RepID=UPI0008851B30|nr:MULTISPECIES: hypothetical protein [unclassified Duganella]SDG70048.1 hypothetical protein SAMN05216320_106216 [Duganella sp. OV458]SDJ95477.1 hypothetical protein SAMN05428973_107217 [Duganella sp. OV510]
MKRISPLWPALLLTLSAHTAFAQSTPGQAPPKLEKIEEVADDGVTITSKQQQKSETQISERRDNSGNPVETTVKSGPSTYTLSHKQPTGTALPGDRTAGPLRGAQWTVMEFDLGQKKKKAAEEEASDNVPPPPPPPAR